MSATCWTLRALAAVKAARMENTLAGVTARARDLGRATAMCRVFDCHLGALEARLSKRLCALCKARPRAVARDHRGHVVHRTRSCSACQRAAIAFVVVGVA